MAIQSPCAQYDAIVIGSNIRGLVASYVLGSLGYKTALLDRATKVGGADASFRTAQGTYFDHGLHVLDKMRSSVATHLFAHVMDGKVKETELRRGIVLRNQIMPYAPAVDELPREFRGMFSTEELVDDIGEDLPTRERLAAVYGTDFADVAFDEILRSYPSEARHLAFGIDESRLMTNIYPWFFPRAQRPTVSDESRAFHDQLRAGKPQHVLYPSAGGFGGFATALEEKVRGLGVDVRLGLSDLDITARPEAHEIVCIEAGGKRYTAGQFFWASPWKVLCELFSLPCQNVATDRVLLGSFTFNTPPHTKYHELLVGDPSIHINRISFPNAFRHTTEPIMQVEFAVPVAESWPLDGEHWCGRWVDDCKRLGVIDSRHVVTEFDFRSFQMHFNAFGAEGESLRDADAGLVASNSNTFPVVPSMANLNLNRYVPRVVQSVTAAVVSRDV